MNIFEAYSKFAYKPPIYDVIPEDHVFLFKYTQDLGGCVFKCQNCNTTIYIGKRVIIQINIINRIACAYILVQTDEKCKNPLLSCKEIIIKSIIE